jgi:hypothetical protein
VLDRVCWSVPAGDQLHANYKERVSTEASIVHLLLFLFLLLFLLLLLQGFSFV